MRRGSGVLAGALLAGGVIAVVAAAFTPASVAGRPLVAGTNQADGRGGQPADRSASHAVLAPDATAWSDQLRPIVVAAATSVMRSRHAGPRVHHILPIAAGMTGAASTSTGGIRLAAPASIAYGGRNRLWIPALGIDRQVMVFSCERSRPPDGGVYRWGCAGRNNVYLMSHAWSTFEPLHDAYVGGRLREGMKAWYADGAGRIHGFSVIWWRLTPPTTAASWAWAPLSRPSMTLQTCVGANNENRLMVRLIEVR